MIELLTTTIQIALVAFLAWGGLLSVQSIARGARISWAGG
jgi:hypothetical protein